MPFLPSLFRGRSTPTPTTPSRSPNEPTTPSSAMSKAPPSAFKSHAPSAPPLTTSRHLRGSPSPIAVKVRDFAHSPQSTTATPYASRPLPATPADSPLKRHDRSFSGASALSSKSSLKRHGHVTPRPAPLTSFTVPKTHNRSASGPSPSPLSSTGLRARASTLPLLSEGKGTEARGSITPPLSLLPSPGPGNAKIARTPESRKRPAALKLRTSNLTPPHSPSPAPIKGSQSTSLSCRPARPGRPGVDVSYSLVQPPTTMTTATPQRVGTLTPRKPSLRRAESAQDLHIPQRPSRPRSLSQSKVQGVQTIKTDGQYIQPPQQSRPVVIADQEILADATPNRSATPFEHVPLPWTSSSASILLDELGPRFEELLDLTLQRLTPTSPRMLRPSILRTSANEESRLRSELERLRDKYSSAVQYRDSLLQAFNSVPNSEPQVLRKTTESLKRAIARCDRLARQIFICNDQIRQIEIQGEEHVVGALRVALARRETGSASTPASSSSASAFSDVEDKAQEQAVFRQALFMPTPEKDPLDASMQFTKHASNRMSTATIISLDQLGFPLPPTRQSSSPPHSVHPIPVSHDVYLSTPSAKIDDSSTSPVLTTGRSAFMSHLDVSIGMTDEILILRPSHRRSASVPLLDGPYGMDMPHTPWRGPDDFTPRKTSSGTAPLRVKATGRRQGIGKAKSMTHKRVSSDVIKRARRGRESSLDNPESILWSLATASLWQTVDGEQDQA